MSECIKGEKERNLELELVLVFDEYVCICLGVEDGTKDGWMDGWIKGKQGNVISIGFGVWGLGCE